MGLNERSNLKYLSVSYGALRCKADPKDPKGQTRKTKTGEVFERVYNSITGVLKDVKFREDEYGKKWMVIISDKDTDFAVQIQEDSRYGTDFLMKLPNLYRGNVYTITPYDMDRADGTGKTNVGISIKDEVGNKIKSYFHDYDVPEGEARKPINGIPLYEKKFSEKKNKDLQKIYFITLASFLREAALNHLKGEFDNGLEHEVAEKEENERHREPPDQEKDDLPF